MFAITAYIHTVRWVGTALNKYCYVNVKKLKQQITNTIRKTSAKACCSAALMNALSIWRNSQNPPLNAVQDYLAPSSDLSVRLISGPVHAPL